MLGYKHSNTRELPVTDVYLNAEEEEDPLVVHVVDLLVFPCVERSQAWLGSRQQLLRVSKPEDIFDQFNSLLLPKKRQTFAQIASPHR